MLHDIKKVTELYLKTVGYLPEGISWQEYHELVSEDASLNDIKLLVDAEIDANYVLSINVDTQSKSLQIGEVKEAGTMGDEEQFKHLFWRFSGGRRSDNIRNTPNKLFAKKKDFSINKLF